MVSAIPFMQRAPWPHFAAEEKEAVAAVLESAKVNYWTGQEGREFEREYAQSVGTKHAIAMMNGSVTLEAAVAALGICGPEHEVIVSPRSFMASASTVVLRGAKPIWADIDPRSGNISAETIARVVTPRTKAVIPVHLGGWPCDMDPIMEFAKSHGFAVIEDCAQSHGAVYRGRQTGSIGHVGSFSFCQDKILTTGGEGGLITTHDDELWSRMWSLKDHGKSYDAVYNRQHPPGFRWLHETFGSNWRMTEIQSAIGRVILRKLPEWTRIRNRNAQILIDQLRGIDGVRLEIPDDDVTHAYYKFYCYARPEALKPDWSRDRILHEIAEQGVPSFSGSCSEMYLEKNFQDAGLAPAERLPVARELGETSMMFLVHPTISESQQHDAAAIIAKVCREATR
jgi:dTDP-4-amino-4,6-dideoxygalactose transaminase